MKCNESIIEEKFDRELDDLGNRFRKRMIAY